MSAQEIAENRQREINRLKAVPIDLWDKEFADMAEEDSERKIYRGKDYVTTRERINRIIDEMDAEELYDFDGDDD